MPSKYISDGTCDTCKFLIFVAVYIGKFKRKKRYADASDNFDFGT